MKSEIAGNVKKIIKKKGYLQKAIAEISEAMQNSKNSINLNRDLYTHQVISYLSKEGFEIDDKNLEFCKIIWAYKYLKKLLNIHQ